MITNTNSPKISPEHQKGEEKINPEIGSGEERVGKQSDKLKLSRSMTRKKISKTEIIKEKLAENSFVKINFGGKQFTDKAFLWFFFSIAIFIIILLKIIYDCFDIGVIKNSAQFSQQYVNVTLRNEDDATTEYLADGVDIFESNFHHGPLDIKVMFTNSDTNYQSFYDGSTFCDGSKFFLGLNDLVTQSVHTSGDGIVYFDKCESIKIQDTNWAQFSLSTQAQVDFVKSATFENGYDNEEDVFKQTEFVLMMDIPNQSTEVNAALKEQTANADTGFFIIVKLNGTQVNHAFNPNDKVNFDLFVPDAIAYVAGGDDLAFSDWYARCLSPEWPSFVVAETVIGLKRYVYDFYDYKVGLLGSAPSQVFMYENPEKEVIHNFVNVEDGISNLVIRIDHDKQMRFTMKFNSVMDVFSAVGGFYTTIAGTLATVYAIIVAKKVQKSVIQDMRKNIDTSFGVDEMDKLRDKYLKNTILDDAEEANEKLEDDIVGSIENNGNPEHVLDLMMKQRDRDQIMIQQDKAISQQDKIIKEMQKAIEELKSKL